MKKRSLALPMALIAAAALMALAALVIRLSAREPDASSRGGRQALLAVYGWEIDPESEEIRSVLIPDCGTEPMREYNALQLRQGYDLRDWEGKQVTQISYLLTNYPGYDQAVYVTLYVFGRRVIAADIHSAALNGFMHGLSR